MSRKREIDIKQKRLEPVYPSLDADVKSSYKILMQISTCPTEKLLNKLTYKLNDRNYIPLSICQGYKYNLVYQKFNVLKHFLWDLAIFFSIKVKGMLIKEEGIYYVLCNLECKKKTVLYYMEFFFRIYVYLSPN